MSFKLTLTYFILIVIVSVILAFIMYGQLYSVQRQAARERLHDIVNFSMPLVDGDFHSLVLKPGDEQTSFYQVVFQRLEAIQATSSAIKHIYTLRQQEDGRIVYVVDAQSNPDLRHGVGYPLEQSGPLLQQGLNHILQPVVEQDLRTTAGGVLLSGYAPVYDQFNHLDGVLVVDLDAAPIIAQETQARNSAVVILVLMLALSLFLGWWLARRMTSPVTELEAGARRISQGQLDQPVPVRSRDELGLLAKTFNTMQNDMRQSRLQLEAYSGSLEERVAERTRQLEVVAQISSTLSTILDFDQLLAELVRQIRSQFRYTDVNIYLLDEASQNLILAEAAEGVQAKLETHTLRIPMQTSASPIARAANTCQVVTVERAQAGAAGPDSAQTPPACAEVAVPILAEGKMVGVLDVQADQTDGLDEADANLLHSLANQVAIALTNAKLFDQVRQRAAELSRTKDEAEIARKEAEAATQAMQTQMWLTTGQAQLSDRMRGEQDMSSLAYQVIQHLCQYLDARVGTLFVVGEDKTLHLMGSYAYTHRKGLSNQFQMGEGLVGQAALEKQSILFSNVPSDYMSVSSSLGETSPRHILVSPFVYNGQVIGVVEIGAMVEWQPEQMDFVQRAMENIAITFNTARDRTRINQLLAQTQQQAEELQVQGEELRVANEELEAQTISLRESEARLKEKQIELESTNLTLEEKAAALEESSAALRKQRAALDQQNQELQVAQQELVTKAEELARASKYKSEFLANMSHELRTPLNSLLILAGMLVKNEEGNLTEEQLESLKIIHSGGQDLLNLINQVLDLAKVEAGRMEFYIQPMPLSELATDMRLQFNPVAESKGLEFTVTLAEDVPETIETDRQRARQIVKNLLSNAFKFTDSGRVSLNIHRPSAELAAEAKLSSHGLDARHTLAISVTDTGIGISADQQQIIFEAFQQANGGTNRKYGGTGLGLSISRELAARLGGHIAVQSQPDQGSTFTLYLPESGAAPAEMKSQGMGASTPAAPSADASVSSAPGAVASGDAAFPSAPRPTVSQRAGPLHPSSALVPPPAPLSDDRAALQAGDRALLIIEDDANFARILLDFCHKKGFKMLYAGSGQTGLQLVRQYTPNAIILDLLLPDMNGWQVLDALKTDPSTRHIPVHIMSVEDETLDAYKRGAIGFLTKPVTQESLETSFQTIGQFISGQIKTLLLVEDDTKLRYSVKKLLEGSDVDISEIDRGQVALDMLRSQRFDCMILDLSLPDMSGFEVLSTMNEDERIVRCPVIVYTGQELTPEQNLELTKYADSVIVKGVKSPERLLDETALFLHRVVANMPEDKRQTIQRLHDKETALAGKKILIVDDDMRNSFALSKLLGDKGMDVQIAHDGQKALDILNTTPYIDLVLMDIMMPVMDGYEAIKQIRAQARFKQLPILALTAKAMRGDREKCLAAGANDYLPKPIDSDRLFTMLRVWLYQ